MFGDVAAMRRLLADSMHATSTCMLSVCTYTCYAACCPSPSLLAAKSLLAITEQGNPEFKHVPC